MPCVQCMTLQQHRSTGLICSPLCMMAVCEHPQFAWIHASMHLFISSSLHASIDRACKVERQLVQNGKAAHGRSQRSMCKGKGHHLLAQGNLFKQGLGAWGQVGLSQALRRLGVWAQQFCLEILTLHPHGVKPVYTHETISKFILACLPCRLLHVNQRCSNTRAHCSDLEAQRACIETLRPATMLSWHSSLSNKLKKVTP